MVMRTLDLGCGLKPRTSTPPADVCWGVDIMPRPPELPRDWMYQQCDLVVQGLEWANFNADSFDTVFAYDVLEHLPNSIWMPSGDIDWNGKAIYRRRDVHINLFNEVYRILKPGGRFETFTPHMPHFQDVFRDPQHVSFWTEDRWSYLIHDGENIAQARGYGLTAHFRLEERAWHGAHLKVVLQALKEADHGHPPTDQPTLRGA